MPNTPGRTAQQIIDHAIRENRFASNLLYAFATVFVASGVFALVVGVLQKQGVVALAGSITSGMFIPTMSAGRSIRRENIAIRLMELPLSKANTADEAAKALNDFFLSALVRDKHQ